MSDPFIALLETANVPVSTQSPKDLLGEGTRLNAFLYRVTPQHHEENLRRVFEAAEKEGAVLYFDEADALFGERTDVESAAERFLRAAAERYRGMVVIASSGEPADDGLVRRSRCIVRLPVPSPPRGERVARSAG